MNANERASVYDWASAAYHLPAGQSGFRSSCDQDLLTIRPQAREQQR